MSEKANQETRSADQALDALPREELEAVITAVEERHAERQRLEEEERVAEEKHQSDEQHAIESQARFREHQAKLANPALYPYYDGGR